MDEESKKETEVIRLGKKMREALEIQKKFIKKACYGCVEPSDHEAGEVIAKKFLKEI